MSWWITDDREEFSRRQRARQDAMSKSKEGVQPLRQFKGEHSLGSRWVPRTAVERSPDDEPVVREADTR